MTLWFFWRQKDFDAETFFWRQKTNWRWIFFWCQKTFFDVKTNIVRNYRSWAEWHRVEATLEWTFDRTLYRRSVKHLIVDSNMFDLTFHRTFHWTFHRCSIDVQWNIQSKTFDRIFLNAPSNIWWHVPAKFRLDVPSNFYRTLIEQSIFLCLECTKYQKLVCHSK